jgi:methionyl-tRNA formyltransferase
VIGDLRLLFFGTPEFAVPTLAALVAAGVPPRLVVSQPDRPAGRGRRLVSPPVVRWARERSLAVAQPERVAEPSFLAALEELAPDLAVVVAYGQIFPPALLSLPRLGCVNVHASLLPRWRGAAPVQAAIAAGDPETGVTTMLMEEGLDSGPLLLRRATPIGETETAGELAARLATLGAELLVESLRGLVQGRLEPVPQPAEGVTRAPKLPRGGQRLDWSQPATLLARRILAASPAPGVEAELVGRPLRLLRARPLPALAPPSAMPGTVIGMEGEALAVAAGEGTVLGLLELQRPGRRVLTARELVNGERLGAGACLR